MFAFVLCMLFNAHPDFWLSPTDFDKKYFAWQSQLVVDLHRDLGVKYARIAREKEEHIARSLIFIAEMVAKEIEFREQELQLERKDKRIELLLRLPPQRNRR